MEETRRVRATVAVEYRRDFSAKIRAARSRAVASRRFPPHRAERDDGNDAGKATV